MPNRFSIVDFPKQMSSKKSAYGDIAGDHCTKIDPNNKKQLKCKYYGKTISGGIFQREIFT